MEDSNWKKIKLQLETKSLQAGKIITLQYVLTIRELTYDFWNYYETALSWVYGELLFADKAINIYLIDQVCY